MLGFWRHLACLFVMALGLCVPAIGHAAWLETRVKSHVATIDVDRQGTATVENEFVLGVRGGPLRSFEIQGIDSDAELADTATVTPVVRFGVPAAIPLAVGRQEDGTLRIEVQRDRGLYTGSYTFRFSYRTNLLKNDRLRLRGPSAELEWIGPRFPDGIDVAKVVFRLPAGPSEPAMAQANDASDAALGSTFLAAIRHDGGKVEVELVRPHVAKGEPALWRIVTDPKAFDALKDIASSPLASRSARVVPIERPSERAAWLGLATLVAAIYGLLIATKSVLFERSARAAGALSRALIPLPTPLRAALGGALLAVAAVLGALGDHPLVASAALLSAIALATVLAARAAPLPRGPGRWFALTEDEAFKTPPPRHAARFLDAGSGWGFLLFAALLLAFGIGASFVARRSSFGALAVLMASLSLIPIFFSGRAAFLPGHRVHGPAPLLLKLKAELGRLGLRCVPWARIPDGAREADELRVLVRLTRPLDGLVAIELGVEQFPSAGGYASQPFVLVRVRDDSAAKRALPADSGWQRGRRPDERVCVHRPPLPTRRHTIALVQELSARLCESPGMSRGPRQDGQELTSRAGIPSPAHAA
jgi:hypothetical protein